MIRELSILCWEGYETDEILDPYRTRERVTTRARTLISDAQTAHELASGGLGRWHVLNINNAYVREYLYPLGLIRRLDATRFAPYDDALLPGLERLFGWRFAHDGTRLGICQRFGAFNLVVDTRRVSRDLAEDQGFELANDPSTRGRFGILEYEDFNIFHVCIGAGLNPFVALNLGQQDAFEATARRWYERAAITTSDHHRLNRALIDGEIDFYLSGGVFTVSPARLAGHTELCAIAPRHGPIDGRGAIAFAEITAVLANPSHTAADTELAESFLEYLLQPDTATRAAFSHGTCNPVAQMGDERVRSAFSAAELDAIQWDSLYEDLARCAEYNIVPSHPELLSRLRAVSGRSSRIGC